MRARILVVAAAVALTVTACASVVDGRGSRVSSPVRTPSATPTTDPVPTTSGPTSRPTPTSTPTPTSSPSATVTPARRLNCAAGAVTASGAPFCYPLPPGFTDFSTLSNYGTGWTYKTLVSVDKFDLVEVFASRYADTSSLSDAELERRFNSFGRLRVGKYDIVRAGDVTKLRVGGARAFRQTGQYRNGVATDYTTIFLGRTVASIQCQSLDHAAQVRDACTTVRSTLQLTSL